MSDDEMMLGRKNSRFDVPMPTCTFAVVLLIFMVAVGSSITILYGFYYQVQVDSDSVIWKNQWWRLYVSVFAVYTIEDLIYLLISFVWMYVVVTQFEKRFSTVYTLYHFWKVHATITTFVVILQLILFQFSKMRNFSMTMAGIFPYCLFMYLKTCLERPLETVNYWFFPMPLVRWFAGLVICCVCLFFTPENQGCLVVLMHYLFNTVLILLLYCMGCFKKLGSVEGPWFDWPFKLAQKFVPPFIYNRQNFIRYVPIGAKKSKDAVREQIEMAEEENI